MKLYVVEQLVSPGVWHPVNLHKGSFQEVLANTQARLGLCVRVKRVKTPAEYEKFVNLHTLNPSIERIEWMN
jgi:hypothetical protein